MHHPLLRSIFFLSGCLLFKNASLAQLTVQNSLTPSELVNSILVGQGVTVSNVTFNGQPANTINDQIGSFNSTSTNLGLANGMVLATGQVPLVVGPNMNPSLTVPPAFPVNTPDPDLAFIQSTQWCVAVLEFDFIPTGDSLSFRFVFGSEEYPEYVCTQFNDVFGFFLSGPGINGPFTNNAINLGVLPDPEVPISINTVNSGSPGILGGGANVCAASDPNWQANSIFYVNNTGGATVELDGFTVPIRALAAVQRGQVYHIKIAIAHAGDVNLDSAVFIEGGSFSSSGSLSISIPNVITPNSDGQNDTWVINGLYRGGSSVKVFNRWGNLVFSSANYANTWRGGGLPDGTYFYEVIDGRIGQHLTGYLTILSNGRN